MGKIITWESCRFEGKQLLESRMEPPLRGGSSLMVFDIQLA